MASNETHFESILNRVREQLNKEKVKLWLPPYSSETGTQGNFPEELIQRYSSNLAIPAHTIVEAFEHLRVHALEKVASKKRFSSTGVATIKVRLAGNIPCDTISSLQIQTELSAKGGEFKKSISRETGMDSERLKLICCGHVVEDDKSLESQFVKNNAQVMVIFLSESEVEARRRQKDEEQAASSLSRMRRAAEVLARRTDDGANTGYYLEINDQNGRPLQLPDSERKKRFGCLEVDHTETYISIRLKALALAMTLHEKGKAALKQKKYAEALLLLLEADKEFNQCRSEILQAVDNYAIVCLDIVWCYFCLQSISDLPNAEEKLKKCEECFERSYGKNLERLTVVRGGLGCELALFVRLHLLEGVCAYLRGHYDKAVSLLAKADQQIRRLKPDDNKLMQLAAMGFSMPESRLALRACNGDVTIAVSHITQRREEKKQRRMMEKEERAKKKLARKLGKTANGDWVNVDTHRTLVSMGYPEKAAREGLRQANNDINQAIQILQEHPELLFIPDDSSPSGKCDISDEVVAQVVSMGFERGVSREALLRCCGSVQCAIEMLISSGGSLPQSSSESSHGSSSGTGSNTDEEEEDPDVEAALMELVPDLTQDEEAYLDLTLEDESALVDEYRALLISNGYSV